MPSRQHRNCDDKRFTLDRGLRSLMDVSPTGSLALRPWLGRLQGYDSWTLERAMRCKITSTAPDPLDGDHRTDLRGRDYGCHSVFSPGHSFWENGADALFRAPSRHRSIQQASNCAHRLVVFDLMYRASTLLLALMLSSAQFMCRRK